MPSRGWDGRRIFRLIWPLLDLAFVVFVAMVAPAWLMAILPFGFTRYIMANVVFAIQIIFGVVLLVGTIGTLSLGAVFLFARHKGRRRPIVARGLLLCGTCLIGVVLAEGVALVVGAPPRSLPAPPARDPALPTTFDENDNSDVTLVVLGESSAAGVPYQKRLSVGKIVAWKLGEVIPTRRFDALVLAQPGDILEGQYYQLSRLRRRPDVLIVYCGHNEFYARVDWSRRVVHYPGQTPNFLERADRLGRRLSALYALIQRANDKYRIELPPSPRFIPRLIDVPSFTPAEFAASLADFRRRLDAIVSFSERVGALPILVIPPGNDAGFEPIRSYLAATTSFAEREAFARDFLAANALPSSERNQAISAYRNLLVRQPGFAEAHYRLGRLLEETGAWDEAYEQYVAARDCDGMPVRCLSVFQQVYRDVAAKHKCILVDSQELFHAIGPHGLLNNYLFNDFVHPALPGHIALATAILDKLRERKALGWQSQAPTPKIDPASCANHFGLGPADWEYVCENCKGFYGTAANLRYDPRQSREKEHIYEQAMQRIAAGEPPESLGLPDVGIPKATQ